MRANNITTRKTVELSTHTNFALVSLASVTERAGAPCAPGGWVRGAAIPLRLSSVWSPATTIEPEKATYLAHAGVPTDPVVATAEDPAVPLHGRDGSRDGGGGSPIRTTGLRTSPLTGAVNNASQQFDLPSPTVAVRNLVWATPSHHSHGP